MVYPRRISKRSNKASSSAVKNRSKLSAEERSPSPTDRARGSGVSMATYTLVESPDSIHSPYFLHSEDQPGLSIIPITLDGANYYSWYVTMTINLTARNKIAFVDGSLPRPAESHPQFKIWSQCNSMVKSWLLSTVSAEIYGSILYFNDAAEIWKDLRTRFHITNTLLLTQQIQDLKQGSMDLSAYFTKLRILWHQLDTAEDCNPCSCCKCGLQSKEEHAKIVKFLLGLNESFSVIRSQVIMMKPVPNLAEIYSILDQNVKQRNIGSSVAGIISPATVLASQTGYQNQKRSRSICSHCGKMGHLIDKCFVLHGYPPGWVPKQRSQQKSTPATTPVTANVTENQSEKGNQPWQLNWKPY